MKKLLKSNDYIKSEWSGGTTTQMAIYPENEVYADRNFLWRLSSATIDLDESDFTKLSDYNRYIATLDNKIMLEQNGEKFELKPLQLHYFDGGVDTKSFGKCKDFNLMLRKNKCSAEVKLLESGTNYTLNANKGMITVLFCINGTCEICIEDENYILDKYDTFIINDEDIIINMKCDVNTTMYAIHINI